MQLVVSDLVFESLPDSATTDVLTDRRKTMVMRDFCAAGAIKLGWDKVTVTGKCFPKEKDLTINMLAETFEAVCIADLGISTLLFVDRGAVYKDSGNDQQVVHEVYTRHFPLHPLSRRRRKRGRKQLIHSSHLGLSSNEAAEKAAAATAEESAMAVKSWWNKF
ncbi:hypothetical protein COCOBI_18-0800 [Coccomyxa sp. Obi]|nr:hypothetical protein COCOBI_18-0800 [Coccomyxa sp. Obi]